MYNYKEHSAFFEQRVKQSLTYKEIANFKEKLLAVTTCKASNTELLILCVASYQTLNNVTEDNIFDTLVFEQYIGVCGNLARRIFSITQYPRHDEIYDIIEVMSTYFYDGTNYNYVGDYLYPIPEDVYKKPWEGNNFKYRLMFIKWLSTHFYMLAVHFEYHIKREIFLEQVSKEPSDISLQQIANRLIKKVSKQNLLMMIDVLQNIDVVQYQQCGICANLDYYILGKHGIQTGTQCYFTIGTIGYEWFKESTVLSSNDKNRQCMSYPIPHNPINRKNNLWNGEHLIYRQQMIKWMVTYLPRIIETYDK